MDNTYIIGEKICCRVNNGKNVIINVCDESADTWSDRDYLFSCWTDQLMSVFHTIVVLVLVSHCYYYFSGKQ